ncbi:tetratricopeptide repeat protein, partial [bacterium]|nr:tetratricopeptide repeat protein [bacterium]
VQDYVAWPYLYLPLAGLAVFMGGLLELIQNSQKIHLRLSAIIIFILLIGLWGLRLGQINMLGNNPPSYWAHIAQNNPQSAKTACALGKAYLREGKISSALQTLFSPVMHDLGEPCRLMAQYYINNNNPLAASVHLRHGMKTEAPGLLYQDYFHVFGNLMFAIQAYDHAEDSYGKISMVNPFNTDSMKQLAHIWHRKGRVAAANRILSQAHELTPRDPSLSQIQAAFTAREQAWKNNPASRQIEPPDPAWLDYILYQNLPPAMMDKILHLGEDADPNDAIIQLEAVVILLEREKPKEASEKAKQVIEQLSGNSSACAIVSRALALAGETELAVKAGLRAIVLDTNNQMAWDCLALAYALQDKPDTIAEQFLNAIQTQPAVAVTFYYNLGMQRQRKHQHKKALEAFQQAVQANPHHYESQLAMGETLYELGQTEDAIEAFQKAAEINPAMDAPFGKLGAARLSQNQILEAVKALQNAIQLNPSVALYHNNLGVCLAKQGREEEAVREYQRAIAIDPQLGRAHFNLGNSWLRVKNTDEAIKAFRETIEVNPNHPHARMNLGVILYRQGDMDEALQVLEQQIQSNPNTPQVYSFLIAVYINLREFEKAWNIVDKAEQARAPLDPKILNALQEVSPK